MSIRCFTCKNSINRTAKDSFACAHPDAPPYCVLKEQLEGHGQWLNILIAGAFQSGKTHYILSLIHILIYNKDESLAKALKDLKLSFEFYNDDSERKFNRFYKDIVKREIIPGTSKADTQDWYTPFILKVRHRGRKNNLVKYLALYNLPGEFFEETNDTRMDSFGQIQTASGVIYIHDPIRDSGLFEYVKIDHDHYQKFHDETPLDSHIIYRLGTTLNPRRRNAPHLIAINRASSIALCISKFDLIEDHIRDRIFDSGYIPNDKLSTSQGRVNREYFHLSMEGLKEVFRRSDLKPNFPYLSSKQDFENFGTFVIAPIGHDRPSVHLPTPKGILAPFLWLLTFFLDI